jgi:PleD family two-component response regulator
MWSVSLRVIAIVADRPNLSGHLEVGIRARGVRWLAQSIMMWVLVVEDDPSVGAAIRMMLDREGYGDCVGRRCRNESPCIVSFDLAIVDIFMPGVSGLATIAAFRKRAPVVLILAMSGFRFRDSMDPDRQ